MNIDDEANPFSNQLYTDSTNSPSEFTGNPYTIADMVTGMDRPACEFDGTCAYTTPNSGGEEPEESDGGDDGGDDNGEDNGDSGACTPIAEPGLDFAYVLTVLDHPLEEYNGDYCADGSDLWLGMVPYKSANGKVFYYFPVLGEWCWQFTSEAD